MTGLILAALLSLAPAAPDTPDQEAPKLLVLSLQPAGVSAEEAHILDGMVANALAPYRTVEVITAEDLAQMVELEGQRQSLGCDSSSCLAEIAGAIGARYVIYGSAGRLGELFVVQLNLFDSVEARSVSREEIQADVLEALAPRVRPAVSSLVTHVTDEELPVAAERPAEDAGFGPLFLAGAGVGGAGVLLAAAGGAGLVVALLTLGSPDSDKNGKNVAVGLAPLSIGTIATGGFLAVGGVTLALVGLGVE